MTVRWVSQGRETSQLFGLEKGWSRASQCYHSLVKVSSHQLWIKHQWPWRSAARNWNLSSERSCSVEAEWENICLSFSTSVSLLFPFLSDHMHIFDQLWPFFQWWSIFTASLPLAEASQLLFIGDVPLQGTAGPQSMTLALRGAH